MPNLGESLKLKEGLPEECQMACRCAIRKLEEVYNQLEMGDITIIDVQKIKEEDQQMKKLCESTSAQQKEANQSVVRTYEALIFTVQQRMQEFEIFREQQGTLLHLCQKIHHEIKGNLYLATVNVYNCSI